MVKKYLIIGLLLAGLLPYVQAQVSMTLQVPPAGVLVKNQLWNMLLVNSGNRSLLIRVNLVLLDAATSQPVLTASSAPISLSKGARQLQAKDLGPVHYNYSIPAAGMDMDPNGMLPAGSFMACYSILDEEKTNTSMLENCIQLNIDPLSPPLLNTPADEETVYTPYPQFTWLPPTPAGIFNDLAYTMIVVEVLPGQGRGDAIQQNIPVYSAGYTRDRYVNYPASYKALDTARQYAWRVVALNNGKAVAMSDIWTFRVVQQKPAGVTIKEEPYVALDRGLNASIATAGNVLRITYDNAAADTTVSYTISSLSDPGNPVVQEGRLPLKYGRNQVQVPLSKNNGWAARKIYLFRFTSSRNETWTVKFTWSPSVTNSNRHNH